MLIFGASCSDWKEKADYAEDKADNEYAKLHEVQCEGIEDVQMAMAAMAAFAVGTQCERFLYHATINLNPGERLTPDQWRKAIETLEKNLKLTGHYRVFFEHIKKNRQHYHIYWSRIPPDGGPAVHMGNNYYVHQRTAKALELAFGLKLAPRGDKTKPSKKKQEINNRNSRLRVNPEIVTKEVTKLFKDSKTAKEFIASLKMTGYILTRGKNGSYVIVDRQGGYHGLLRRIKGAKLDDLRQKFPDLEKTALPYLSDVLKSRSPVSIHNFKRAAGSFKRPRRIYNMSRLPKIRPLFYRPRHLTALILQAISRHPKPQRKSFPAMFVRRRGKRKRNKNSSDWKTPFRRPEWDTAELLAWAWENGRADVLADFGIHMPLETFEP